LHAHSAQMRPIAADVTLAKYVCLCVRHTDVLCKNSWTDQDMEGQLLLAQGTTY